MSIASEITRLQTAKADIKAAIEDKGVTVPSAATLDDYADYVSAISGGGGIDIEDIAKNTFLSGAVQVHSNLAPYAFDNKGQTSIPWTLKWTGSSAGQRSLNATKGLTTLVITGLSYYANAFYSNGTDIAILDTSESRFPSSAWASCPKLKTVILRHSTVITVNNANLVTGTPFANGNSGGTIYIPKALYDHLGDGTSSDYKSATNWSTIDGYGTITWAAIEGSQYETAYADGTPISS